MKDYSAAQIKRGFKTALQQTPRPNTKIREVYDLFMAYKGQIIQFDTESVKKKNSLSLRIKYLQLFYGMDITHVGLRKWRLAGEWIGSKYVSYEVRKPLNIKLKKKDQEQ